LFQIEGSYGEKEDLSCFKERREVAKITGNISSKKMQEAGKEKTCYLTCYLIQ
jgi:hypothetical protein